MTKPESVLHCWLRPDRRGDRSYYFRFAGRTLVTDAPLAALAPFAVAETAPTRDDRRPALTGSGHIVCRRTGWVSDDWREVEVRRHERGMQLRLAGVGEFAVSAEGVAVIRSDGEIASEAMTEILLGPPLLLALALQGLWCIHASAATLNGRVVAFAGESGQGKSTLAAHLADAAGDGSIRVADDVLPISLRQDGVAALPHFPQLKLQRDEQYPVEAPADRALAAVYVVAPSDGCESVNLHRLDRRQAMQSLIRHTIAARLFDKPLLDAHLDFCANAATCIPVWRLEYPHRREMLLQVRDAIRRSLLEPAPDTDRSVAAAGADG